ncbi:MAG: dolichyl-phosphate beta-D-mannosyltransferase [Candidatus Omnitrophica bacterium CG11_big_fil_rev_8_21_14_0_20_42_13]|uniref:Dolichyl-phosphate beta-D-mannosyltransferase n=1 Tax=Candidatus Ghiorseimicrobium undicola TaxID=1974746 RepID=A0A2H0LW45_9BACT|nr:MAG: dolichyl-phosphate beta-D-mannosyltransferase [Candidatus Omnitrophica bacterium CG11_big_fil_rev_8_21_14_0_20_42_13]
MQHKTLIVIPTYNERDNIGPLINDIFCILPYTDILIVDDNSPDGTQGLVESLASANARIKLIKRPSKAGLGSAYLLGFKHGIDNGYDFILQMDADYSHQPKYLKEFLNQIRSYDLVVGSRYITGGEITGWGFFRKMLSYCGNLYARYFLGIPLKDLTGGYNCYRRKALEDILGYPGFSDGYIFQVEMKLVAYKKGFRIKEIPIVFENRRRGKSKISKKIIFQALAKVPLIPWRVKRAI